ncbi:MAG: PBP1A family penicillin-binding protein [Deltaproteobacteria bacterium]|nr:PBP1A family penicillin-binding protein [Deltaproteobacteria bacterium]
MAKPDPARRSSPKRPRLLWRLARATLLLAAVSAALGLVLFRAATVYLEAQLPEVLTVADYRAHALQTTRVHAADGRVIAEWWRERRTVVPGERIPRHVRLAAVAAEDGDFYQHEGLDIPGMLRALVVNLRDGRYTQGASTITQQVARSFYLSQEKTLRRKVLEVFLARKLEKHLEKDEILELYLNQIYFGHGRWGIAEAARHYLGKSVQALEVADAALLMSLVPAPERLNPIDDPEGARGRRDRVLERMLARGFIDAATAEAARRAPVPHAARDEAVVAAPWFVDAVRRRLEVAVGADRLMGGGLRVDTTLRPDAQEALERAVALHLGTAEASPEAAAVLMDPATREVLALVGGKDFERSPYNRAVQARRQAGSTFKPFVYGAGIEAGVLSPTTTYPNRLVCYPGGRRRWCPGNADGRHDGAETTVAEALRRSLNVIAVQAMRDTGVARVTDFARRAGIRSPIPADLTAALGSADVSLMELVDAYATIASGGLAGTPVMVRRVEDAGGSVIFSESPRLHRAFSPEVAAALTRMLSAVVAEGTGRGAALEGVRVAGKTGTTNDRVDAWFVGFSVPESGPATVGGVWVGHDARRPIAGGSGGRTAAPLWADAVSAWLGVRPASARGAPAAEEPPPDGPPLEEPTAEAPDLRGAADPATLAARRSDDGARSRAESAVALPPPGNLTENAAPPP